MNLRICFKIAKEVEMATDEEGNFQEAFVSVKAKNIKSYEAGEENREILTESFKKLVASQLECDEKYLTPITLDEYLDNTEEGDTDD